MWPLLAAGTLVEVVLLSGNGVRGRGRLHVLLAPVGALAVCGTIGLVVEHLQAQQRRVAEWAHASAVNSAQLLPRTPARAAQVLLREVTEADPTVCITLLVPEAADRLSMALSMNACRQGPTLLHARPLQPLRAGAAV